MNDTSPPSAVAAPTSMGGATPSAVAVSAHDARSAPQHSSHAPQNPHPGHQSPPQHTHAQSASPPIGAAATPSAGAAPTPSAATPSVPTPSAFGAPTPGAPTPGAPTPSAPTPGAPTPGGSAFGDLPDDFDQAYDWFASAFAQVSAANTPSGDQGAEAGAKNEAAEPLLNKSEQDAISTFLEKVLTDPTSAAQTDEIYWLDSDPGAARQPTGQYVPLFTSYPNQPQLQELQRQQLKALGQSGSSRIAAGQSPLAQLAHSATGPAGPRSAVASQSNSIVGTASSAASIASSSVAPQSSGSAPSPFGTESRSGPHSHPVLQSHLHSHLASQIAHTPDPRTAYIARNDVASQSPAPSAGAGSPGQPSPGPGAVGTPGAPTPTAMPQSDAWQRAGGHPQPQQQWQQHQQPQQQQDPQYLQRSYTGSLASDSALFNGDYGSSAHAQMMYGGPGQTTAVGNAPGGNIVPIPMQQYLQYQQQQQQQQLAQGAPQQMQFTSQLPQSQQLQQPQRQQQQQALRGFAPQMDGRALAPGRAPASGAASSGQPPYTPKSEFYKGFVEVPQAGPHSLAAMVEAQNLFNHAQFHLVQRQAPDHQFVAEANLAQAAAGTPASEAPSSPRSGASLASNRRRRDYLSEDQVRLNHIHSEKRRRDNIKQLFAEMSSMVPSIEGKADQLPKSVILQKVYAYIVAIAKQNKEIRAQLREANVDTSMIPVHKLSPPMEGADNPSELDDGSRETSTASPARDAVSGQPGTSASASKVAQPAGGE